MSSAQPKSANTASTEATPSSSSSALKPPKRAAADGRTKSTEGVPSQRAPSPLSYRPGRHRKPLQLAFPGDEYYNQLQIAHPASNRTLSRMIAESEAAFLSHYTERLNSRTAGEQEAATAELKWLKEQCGKLAFVRIEAADRRVMAEHAMVIAEDAYDGAVFVMHEAESARADLKKKLKSVGVDVEDICGEMELDERGRYEAEMAMRLAEREEEAAQARRGASGAGSGSGKVKGEGVKLRKGASK